MRVRSTRAIRPVGDFAAAVAALGSPQAAQLVHALLQRIAGDPGCAPLITGTNVRILHTLGFDAYPPLTLFYGFDDGAVYPLHVEAWDLALG